MTGKKNDLLPVSAKYISPEPKILSGKVGNYRLYLRGLSQIARHSIVFRPPYPRLRGRLCYHISSVSGGLIAPSEIPQTARRGIFGNIGKIAIY